MASIKPVFQKLGLKPTHRAAILRVPAGVKPSLGKPPAGVRFEKKLSGASDFILGFYESKETLRIDLTKIRKALTPAGMAWVCWRKGGVTDLNREAIWSLGESAGLDSVASCAIDDDWSAMKLMFPKAQRS